MEYPTLFQRLFWLWIFVSHITFATVMVVSLWDKFSIHPTVTTLVSSSYPVNRIPFPGIAICPINKISLERAQNAAHQIANLTRRDFAEIMTFMRFMGQLHDNDFEASSLSNLLEFQNILDSLGITVKALARELVTPCEELLRSCFWRGLEVNCSSYFFLRRTNHGYCCVFNYVKMTDDFLQVNEPLTTDAGVENGLYVSVNNHPTDYYYTTVSSLGVMLHIFIPTDYPDKSSGGLTEILTQPNSENFIEITPTTITSVEDVANFNYKKRGCLFEHERQTAFRSAYSQSDCNVECRVLSIEAMCQCVPYMIPLSDEQSMCTLADIPCLNRYKDKWHSHFPDEDVGEFLGREKQDSLRCSRKCYPPCWETVYEALANSFPIFNKTEKQQNITRMYVYYANRFSNLYQQDVVYYWFEMLSNFGGIFGIFVGWSLISLIQFVHHYLKTIYEKLLRH